MRVSSFVLVSLAIGITAGCAHESSPAFLPASNVVRSAGAQSSSSSYKVVHSFNTGADAQFPQARMTVYKGTLYGTATAGGTYNVGAVFTMSANGTERVVHSFKYSDGSAPVSGVRVMHGELYGTTALGGAHGQGTVFRMTPSGKLTVLHSFKAGPDGFEPLGDLTAYNGTIYGTTYFGGGTYGSSCFAGSPPIGPSIRESGCGTIFKVSASGQESRVVNFNGPAGPLSNLIPVKGALYGSTYNGPDTFCSGTVYSLNDSGQVSVVHYFGGSYGCDPDGGYPAGDLVYENGALYGTTYYGGNGSCAGALQCGTVFRVTPSGNEAVIYNFKGAPDGFWPTAGLTPLHGLLYGVTQWGGSGYYGICGILFSITASGQETILHNFAGGTQDGCSPTGGLVALHGTLYGTTSGSGLHNTGTVFSFTP
ncbi:MAG: choice-of-anchor tandem repeat GloVer-containing protein [Candidatus Cybelea sp.]